MKAKANEDLRRVLRDSNVPFWKLAVKWGCSEVTAVKRFRFELSPDSKNEILAMIREIVEEENA